MERAKLWLIDKARGSAILVLSVMITLVDFTSKILSVVFDGVIALAIVALAWPFFRRKG